MSLLQRPAYWIGSLTSLALVFGSFALMLLNYLPDGSVAIAARIACVTMFATLAYVAFTNPNGQIDAQNTELNRDLH